MGIADRLALAPSLIGRGRELKELQRLLERGRLVTLMGAGGAGKTRLAMEAASLFGRLALAASTRAATLRGAG